MADPSRKRSPEAEIFGKTLRRLREERGLTQEKLAHAAGLTTSYTSDLERGLKVPSLTTILALAGALQVEPVEMLRDFRASNETTVT
jgi:transcriptional regulator with XRE-family HTH domain